MQMQRAVALPIQRCCRYSRTTVGRRIEKIENKLKVGVE
jgi:hypothetical protein